MVLTIPQKKNVKAFESVDKLHSVIKPLHFSSELYTVQIQIIYGTLLKGSNQELLVLIYSFASLIKLDGIFLNKCVAHGKPWLIPDYF